MDAQKLGSFIAQRRKELGLTQAGLADKLHITDKAISRWERGVGLPDIQLLEPLAQALDLNLIELVRARTAEKDMISIEEAEKAVSATIGLSRKGKARQVVGAVILGLIGIACAFLLWLLITEGIILLFSVGSIVTGLIAWAVPVWCMTFAHSADVAASGAVSFGAALTSLTIQFFHMANSVDNGDFAAIEDTIHVLCIVVVQLCAITLLLNFLMIRKAKQ